MSNSQKVINEYINALKEKDVLNELEHTGRTPLENLLDVFAKPKNVQVTHEPSRDKNGKGSPDFRFKLNDNIIGYLENKKINEKLDDLLEKGQIEKYKQLTSNLLITDYLRWIWLENGTIKKDLRLCDSILLEQKNEIIIDLNIAHKLATLLEDFFQQESDPIIKANILAGKLSEPTKEIKEQIVLLLEQNNKSILDLYNAIKQELSEHISPDEFSDMVAQTFTYSLFLTKLSLGSGVLNLDNIGRLTPQSFGLIRNIIKKLTVIDELHDKENKRDLFHAIEKVLTFINITDSEKILEDLQSTKKGFKDPYIHFYENFLNAYDKNKRKELGVWFTPQPVVKAIVRNVDFLLRKEFFHEEGEEFNSKEGEGLANENLKLLDFACGTGTFLLEIYNSIFSSFSGGNLKKGNLITNHILKNLYGFELLMPAYAVAHLKLSERLKQEGYELKKDERIPVYFTNTLEDQTKQDKQNPLDNSYEEIKKEGRLAHQIKENKDILVIVGNPPYNGKSRNNFPYINKLIRPYFPNDDISEEQVKWINDDYVKFIRFAEHKIQQAGKGIVGMITNHGFLDNPTFRAMRQHLMKTFEQIYIVDLHGNAKKKEKSPDGSTDQNVFDIETGVCLSFFVKKEGLERGIFHKDIYGKREFKFEQLNELTLDLEFFTKIEPLKPFDFFTPLNKEIGLEYYKGISLRNIFIERKSGIVTGRDKKVIAFTQKELESKIDSLLSGGELYTREEIKLKIDQYSENINYRPFDVRKIYWDTETKGIIERPSPKIMKHFLGHENRGLIFTRQVNGDFFHAFISDKITESCFISTQTGEINSVAPLYLYQDNLFEQGEVHNFQEPFWTMIQDRFNKPSPEEVLAYIYSILYSPTYRTKYLEFLKIDFPWIPFDINQEEFIRLSHLGQKLIDAHLMNTKFRSDDRGEQGEEGQTNPVVETIAYKEEEKRVYFNKTTFFEKVSKEVWEFRLGGYQVLSKFLEERKGRDISGDLDQVKKIIQVLEFTLKTMKEIG